MSDRAYFEAALSAAIQPEDYVLRTGKIFECGEYPDKEFSLTEDEADSAIAEFTPVSGDIEHPRTRTVLGGKVGTLQRVWREGKALIGEVAVPQWLDPLVSEEGRKVSLAWDRASKRITGWGWVVHPRVSDAALMSAYFSAHPDDPEAPQKEKTTMSFSDKVKAWFNAGMPEQFEERDPGDESTTDTGTTTTTTSSPPPTPAPVPSPPAPEPAPAVMSAEFSALLEENKRLRRESNAREAAAFADSLVRQSKAFPAERDHVAALFALALDDDSRAPQTVTFAVGDEQATFEGRAALIRAAYEARPAHPLTTEQVPDPKVAAVLFNKGETADQSGKPIADEVLESLLGATLTGKQALKERTNGAGSGKH